MKLHVGPPRVGLLNMFALRMGQLVVPVQSGRNVHTYLQYVVCPYDRISVLQVSFRRIIVCLSQFVPSIYIFFFATGHCVFCLNVVKKNTHKKGIQVGSSTSVSKSN